MKYPFYVDYKNPVKEIAIGLKKNLRNYFETITKDKMAAETFARKGVGLIIRAVAAPGRAPLKEVSVGSIPIPPTNLMTNRTSKNVGENLIKEL